MKNILSKGDLEKALSSASGNKMKLKRDGSDTYLLFLYLLFLKEIGEATDLLMCLDNSKRMKAEHILGAAKKVLPKFDYAHLVRKRIKKSELQTNLKDSKVKEPRSQK